MASRIKLIPPVNQVTNLDSSVIAASEDHQIDEADVSAAALKLGEKKFRTEEVKAKSLIGRYLNSQAAGLVAFYTSKSREASISLLEDLMLAYNESIATEDKTAIATQITALINAQANLAGVELKLGEVEGSHKRGGSASKNRLPEPGTPMLGVQNNITVQPGGNVTVDGTVTQP